MRRQYSTSEVAIANGVSNHPTAENLKFGPGEVGNLLIVGAGLGVPESNDACDLILDTLGEVLNSPVVDSCTLTTIIFSAEKASA